MVVTLRDMQMDPETVCYIGCARASSFFWIGRREDVPKQYLDEPVVKTHHRYSDHEGIIILFDGNGKKFFGGKEPPGYWFWSECDPSVQMVNRPIQGSERSFENLLVALARDEARYYKARLNDAIVESAKHKDCMTREEADEMVRFVRQMCSKNLILLPGSNVGDYMLLRIEDEARAKAMYPRKKWLKLKYQKQLEYIDRMTRQFRQERYKQNEHEHYASIKGRSVKHERDS